MRSLSYLYSVWLTGLKVPTKDYIRAKTKLLFVFTCRITRRQSQKFTRRANVQTTHNQVQIGKIVYLKYTPMTQSIMCRNYFMYVLTIHSLNYGGQESKKNNLQFMTLTTLTLDQSHQSWYDQAKFEIPCLNSVCESQR